MPQELAFLGRSRAGRLGRGLAAVACVGRRGGLAAGTAEALHRLLDDLRFVHLVVLAVHVRSLLRPDELVTVVDVGESGALAVLETAVEDATHSACQMTDDDEVPL